MSADARPLGELDELALTVWAEAAGEPIEGKVGVASVIRNRLKSGRWGTTYAAVVHARFQFSCWNDGEDLNHRRLLAAAEAVKAGRPPDDAALRECYWVAQGCISGAMRDRTYGSTHYLTRDLWVKQPPSWTVGKAPEVSLGGQVFFAHIR